MGFIILLLYFCNLETMSTRATITVSDGRDNFHIYKHWDGEPSAVIPDIEKAVRYAWSFPRFEAWDFSTAIIRVMKKREGWIYLTCDANMHSNRSFHYKVSELGWNLNVEITEM